MTFRNARDVLSFSFAIVLSVFLCTLLWKQSGTQDTRVHFYQDEVGTQLSSNESREIADQDKADSWRRFVWRSSVRPRLHTVGTIEPHHPENISSLPAMEKESFSKMPTWEFEDLYIQNVHPNEMMCQSSFRRTADLEFNRSFIPNIQLFMHQGHLNISEWNRLAHFNNPFGFMGYHYADIKKAVDLIPKLKDYNLLPLPSTSKSGCIRCAVVATGGILSGSRMGKEIDSHDYVFRMNGAVVQGHEEDVGNRTSVYVHTAHSLLSSLYTLQKYGFRIPRDEGIKYVLIPEGLRDFQWLHGLVQKKSMTEGIYAGTRPWTLYPSQLDMNNFYVLHPDFLRYIRNRFLKSENLQSPYWYLYRPTNGAFTMFLALHTCDMVDAYGFITADYSKYSNYYFETVTKTSVVFYLNHDYNLEINLWKKLHDSRVIRLYQREGDKEEPFLTKEMNII